MEDLLHPMVTRQAVGQPLPPDTPHVSDIFSNSGTLNDLSRLSVSLPTWKAVLATKKRGMGLKSNEMRLSQVRCLLSRFVRFAQEVLRRFFIDPAISSLAKSLVADYGDQSEQAILLPSRMVATQCMTFLRGQDGGVHGLKTLDLYIRPAPHGANSESARLLASPIISAVIISQCLLSKSEGLLAAHRARCFQSSC